MDILGFSKKGRLQNTVEKNYVYYKLNALVQICKIITATCFGY